MQRRFAYILVALSWCILSCVVFVTNSPPLYATQLLGPESPHNPSPRTLPQSRYWIPPVRCGMVHSCESVVLDGELLPSGSVAVYFDHFRPPRQLTPCVHSQAAEGRLYATVPVESRLRRTCGGSRPLLVILAVALRKGSLWHTVLEPFGDSWVSSRRTLTDLGLGANTTGDLLLVPHAGAGWHSAELEGVIAFWAAAFTGSSGDIFVTSGDGIRAYSDGAPARLPICYRTIISGQQLGRYPFNPRPASQAPFRSVDGASFSDMLIHRVHNSPRKRASQCSRVVIMDRRSSRSILNVGEVKAEIQHAFGAAAVVGPVYFEDLSPRGQLDAVWDARALVGPHGAGLIWAFFMPIGAVLVELVPFKLHVKDYMDIARWSGLRYGRWQAHDPSQFVVVRKPDADYAEKMAISYPDTRDQNLRVPSPVITSLLRHSGASAPSCGPVCNLVVLMVLICGPVARAGW